MTAKEIQTEATGNLKHNTQSKPWKAKLYPKSISELTEGVAQRGEWGTPVYIEYDDDVNEPPGGYQPPTQVIVFREDFDFGDYTEPYGDRGPVWKCPMCGGYDVYFCFDDVYLCDQCGTIAGYLFWLESIPAGLAVVVEVRA